MEPLAARRAPIHVYVNVGLMAFLFAVHLLFAMSTLLNVGMFAASLGPYHVAGTPAFDQGRLVGNVIAFALTGTWSVAGIIWIPFNIYGLLRRRPWAITSTLVYWVMSTMTICCAPFGIYGLISMLDKDVKAYLTPEA